MIASLPSLQNLTLEQSRELLELLTELKQRKLENRLEAYSPYPKQVKFHNEGGRDTERLFMAGNQIGKTVAGGAETAIHLTGRYPDWWQGAVFDRPVKTWVGGVTSESTRDNPQRILVGQPQIKDLYGTGLIPRDALVDYTTSRGVPDALDSLVTRWGGGGDVTSYSTLLFKSYEKGREKWQGDTVDFIWFDEEPPADIYSEGKTRTNKGQLNNCTMITATPLLGMSEIVRSFLTDDQDCNTSHD